MSGILLKLAVMVLLCQLAASTSGNCRSPLTNNFTADCSDGNLKKFLNCLQDAEAFTAAVTSKELNRQYCHNGTCEFTCSGNFNY